MTIFTVLWSSCFSYKLFVKQKNMVMVPSLAHSQTHCYVQNTKLLCSKSNEQDITAMSSISVQNEIAMAQNKTETTNYVLELT